MIKYHFVRMTHNVSAVAAGAGHQNTKKTNSTAGPCGIPRVMQRCAALTPPPRLYAFFQRSW